ncbi:MAG: dockerin type I repeat-containing protein, partial [Porcipelethomonas sp.]
DVTTTTAESAEILVPEGVTATKYGDVNTDGEVSVADVVSINMLLLSPEKNPLTDIQLANSDCVKNNIINAADSSMILNFVSMMVSEDQLGKAE